MSRKVIITCAITGGADSVGKHPAIPVTPQQIAQSAIEAHSAGAAVAHIHVRDPETGMHSGRIELFREVVEIIRASGSKVIINLTTGEGGRYVPSEKDPATGGPGTSMRSPQERVAHVLELKPEICTLDAATMNFGESVFMNTPAHLRIMAQLIKDAGVKPELEAFDLGHLQLARQLIAEGLIAGRPLLQLCLGISWGAPATSAALNLMHNSLPNDADWAAFGIGATEFPMVAQAALLGGNVRVGLEDNLYIERGVLARDNAQLVEKAVKVLEILGFSVASSDEAREQLNLRQD